MRWAVLFLLLFLGNTRAFAVEAVYTLQAFQSLYSGEDEETFSEDNPGVGAEISISTLNSHLNWVAKGRLTTISGNQKFDDNGTSRSLDFTFYQSAFEGGFKFYPFARKKTGINLFFGGNALMSFNYLSFSNTASLTNLDPSYQNLSFGYVTNIGIEWYPFRSSKWAITSEFSQRNETARLADVSKFSLNALSLAFGFSW